MAYGTVAGVARVSAFTRNGSFYDEDIPNNVKATVPPLATVTAWLTTMSSYMDAALKDAFFVTPVTGTYAVSYSVINTQVELLVADLIAARNQSGRFFMQTTDAVRDLTNWSKIQAELIEWVSGNVNTFIAEGVPQITANPIRAGQPMVILKSTE